ncbi:MAG: MBL fold metallo-hydrolase RNA specificity domain-containing protein [Pirellulaceae bacterium]|nr:MBL fold metallo-hydrolase RNA specificity domain-containing protein [Pirellulaceae bacterium]
MFHYDGGLKITAIDLAVDFRRRQPRGFISHAHSDHMARHELAICTPETAALYRKRFGPRPTRDLPHGQTLDWDGIELSTHPAGHVLGSAMLLVEGGGERLLYTGDFKLGPSATAAEAQPPRADILVMESTFGDPRYRLPPRDEVVAELLAIVERALADGRTPVIQAYVLGKAQEVTKILADRGHRIEQHRLVQEITDVYEACGCRVGSAGVCTAQPPAGTVIVAPPRWQKGAALPRLERPVTIAVTGWASDPRWRLRHGVDYAVPLSDHADYDDLIECIGRVQPRVVYCTHGPEEFVGRLQKLGHHALPLAACRAGARPSLERVQGSLF